MPYKHTMVRQIAVPTILLAVLKQVVFGVLRGLYQVHVVVVANVCGTAHGYVAGVVEDGRLNPVHAVALVYAIQRRCACLVVVAAVVHDRPFARCKCRCVCGRVEVGQAQHVSKLVAEGADTGNNRAGSVAQLVRAGIMVDALTVEDKLLAEGLVQVP